MGLCCSSPAAQLPYSWSRLRTADRLSSQSRQVVACSCAPEAANCVAGGPQHQGSSADRVIFDNVVWHCSRQTGCSSCGPPSQAFWHDGGTIKPFSSIPSGDPNSEGSTYAVRLLSHTICIIFGGHGKAGLCLYLILSQGSASWGRFLPWAVILYSEWSTRRVSHVAQYE